MDLLQNISQTTLETILPKSPANMVHLSSSSPGTLGLFLFSSVSIHTCSNYVYNQLTKDTLIGNSLRDLADYSKYLVPPSPVLPGSLTCKEHTTVLLLFQKCWATGV